MGGFDLLVKSFAYCNKNRSIENCEDCDAFPCERIQRFFDYHKRNNTGHVFN